MSFAMRVAHMYFLPVEFMNNDESFVLMKLNIVQSLLKGYSMIHNHISKFPDF